jgi:hypothetical protein
MSYNGGADKDFISHIPATFSTNAFFGPSASHLV